MMDGYGKPYRLDVTKQSGGLLVYVTENIPSHIKTELKLPGDIRIVPVEINLRKQKWLIISIYRPPDQHLHYFLVYDFYTRTVDNILVMGDFNSDPQKPAVKNLIQTY